MLLAKGVDANAVYANDLTALMWAAGFGKTATVKALLDAGARADLKDNRGKTALDIAREGKFDETAKLLENAGAAGRAVQRGSPADRPPRSARMRCHRPRRGMRRPMPIRASNRSRSTSACFSAAATCSATAAAIIQLVARCTPLSRSLSGTFLPPRPAASCRRT